MPPFFIRRLLQPQIYLTIVLIFSFWSLPLQAANKSAADIRVLVDVSGSMKQNDPRNLRRPAMDLLLQLFPDSSRAGVWTFGRYVNMLVEHGEVNKKWRSQSEPQSRLINSVALHTNIGLALEKANYDSDQKLFPSSNNYNKSVILLTDGVVDINQDPAVNDAERQRILNEILPAYKAAGVKIHTVALSTNADVELLETLSKETDGVFAVAEDAEDLNKIFLRAFDQASPGDRVPLEDNRFLIDSSIEEFTVLVFNQPGSEKTQLTSPSGDRYDAASNDSQLRWFESEQYDLITIQRPVEGEWRINAEFDPENRVTVVSDLSLEVEALPNNLYLGSKLNLSASITDGEQVITDANFLKLLKVDAAMARDNAKFWQQQLKPDLNRLGMYVRKLDMLSNAGNYSMTVRIDGKTFKREKKLSFSVREPFRVELAANEEQAEYAVTVFADDQSLRVESVTVEATVLQPDGQSAVVRLDQNRLGVWSFEATDQLTGSYQIELRATGRNKEGDAINLAIATRNLYLNVPGVAESIPLPVAEVIEEIIPEEPVKTEAPAEKEPEQELLTEDQQAEPEEEGSRWMLYAALAAGNVLLFGGLFFLYKKLLSGSDEDDDSDSSNTEETAPEEKESEEEKLKPKEPEKESAEKAEEVSEKVEEPATEDPSSDEDDDFELDVDLEANENVVASLLDAKAVDAKQEASTQPVAEGNEIEKEIDLNAMLDDGLPENGLLEDDLLSDELLGDELLGDEPLGDKVPADELLGDELLGDELLGDELLGDELLGDELLGDELLGDELLGDEMLDDTMLDVDVGAEEEVSIEKAAEKDALDDEIDAVLAQFESSEESEATATDDEKPINFELDGEFDLSSDISDDKKQEQ